MLIRIFRSSFYAQYLLLLILAALLWLKLWFNACSPPEAIGPAPLYELLLRILPEGIAGTGLLAFALLLFQAFLINFILIRHGILPKNSLLAALVFIMLMSLFPELLNLNPMICAGTFVALSFNSMMKTYGSPDPTGNVFSAAFLLAFASLFYLPAILMFFLLLLSFALFGTFSPRMLFVAFSGVIAVYLYLFVFYFILDDLQGRYCLYENFFMDFPSWKIDYTWPRYVILGLFSLLFLFAFLQVLSQINEWNIMIRKKVLLGIWFVVVALGSLAYGGNNPAMAMQFAVLPGTLLISSYLLQRRKTGVLLELFFLLLLLVVVANNLLDKSC